MATSEVVMGARSHPSFTTTGWFSALVMIVCVPLSLAIYGGLMFGLGAVAGLSYVMGAAPGGSLGLATACYFMAGTVGNALGSAVSGVVAREMSEGYRVIGFTMTFGHLALMAVAAAVLPALPRPEAARTLNAVVGGYGDIMRSARVPALLALRFLPTVYWGCATFLMPLLLFRITGSEKPAGYYASVSMVLSAICQLAMGRIVDHFGARVPVVAAITLVAIASLGQGVFASNLPALVGFGLLGAGAAWSLSVAMTTLVQEVGTENTKSKLLGLTHVAWSLGFLAGTAASGFLAREYGRGGGAFLISAACCAVAILCAIRVVNGLGPRPTTET
ncbi:MAG: MFS transporter, partial [Actinomycetota bacterium]